MKLITWLSGLAGCVQVNVILRVRHKQVTIAAVP